MSKYILLLYHLKEYLVILDTTRKCCTADVTIPRQLKVLKITNINRAKTLTLHILMTLGANPGVYYKLVFATYEQIL